MYTPPRLLEIDTSPRVLYWDLLVVALMRHHHELTNQSCLSFSQNHSVMTCSQAQVPQEPLTKKNDNIRFCGFDRHVSRSREFGQHPLSKRAPGDQVNRRKALGNCGADQQGSSPWTSCDIHQWENQARAAQLNSRNLVPHLHKQDLFSDNILLHVGGQCSLSEVFMAGIHQCLYFASSLITNS